MGAMAGMMGGASGAGATGAGAAGAGAAGGAAASGGIMKAIGQGLVAAGGDEKANDAVLQLNALKQQDQQGTQGQQLRSDIMKYALQGLAR